MMAPNPHWKAIAAMAENRVIGNGNNLPWHLPEDFRFFKAQTTGHTLLMGRKTYESIGKPLPGRETIVLSRHLESLPGVRVVKSLDSLKTLPLKSDLYLCGGAQLYEQALPLCAELLLTRVFMKPAGDAFFPPFEETFERTEILRETDTFRIERYRNRFG